MAIVSAVLLVMAMSNMTPRALIASLGASLILLLAACGSEAAEQAQEVSVVPTSIPTTPPLSAPTATQVPAPSSTVLPEVTSTPTVAPTVAHAPEPTPAAAPTTAPATEPASTAAPAGSDETEAVETSTPVPIPTVEDPGAEADTSLSDSESDVESVSTPVAETATAVVASSGEPPLECFDADVNVYRAFVDGVDALSFEGGRVFCTGAGTNAVSAPRSYRHSSGLVVRRNADFTFNDAGTAYIPYSGSIYFCLNGQPASAPLVADTVPALLIVIDNEAKRQLAEGATGPVAFSGSASQC